MHRRPRVLVVDDDADAREILTERLSHEGFDVSAFADGATALDAIRTDSPDVILLDVMMPGLSGLETLARIKAAEDPFVPTILVTAKGEIDDVVTGLNRGADEYIVKPFDHAALTARVRAMLRLKALHDELAELNGSLEQRVERQVDQIQRMSRLQRFLAPQVAEAILASPDAETALETHRREVAVIFCDLRGFTAFTEAASPDELMSLLRDYHDGVGRLAFAHGGTLERFAGDSVMVIFNDPVEVEDYCLRAVRFAFDVLRDTEPLMRAQQERGFDLGIGIGLAQGPAILGRIGFRERLDYAAIGQVTNLASRFSSMASHSQILTDAEVARAAVRFAQARPLGRRPVKGLREPLEVFELIPRPAR